MRETLKCEQCEKNWRREKTRGRKPKLCPKCLKAFQAAQPRKAVVEVQKIEPKKVRATRKDKVAIINSAEQHASLDKTITVGTVYRHYHPQPPDADELRAATKGGSTWRCTFCKHEIKLFLPVSAPPTHKCSETSKSKPCERIS